MAYEHESEKDAVVNAVFDVIGLIIDGVQPQEILPIINDVLAASSNIQKVLGEEEKRIFKLKFAAKVGIGLSNKALDSLIPDEA